MLAVGLLVGAGGGEDEPEANPQPRPAELPRGGRTILPDRRVVAFYGAPQDRELAVLGIGSPRRAARRLEGQARPYGFGDQPNRISKYNEFTKDLRRRFNGFKLFYARGPIWSSTSSASKVGASAKRGYPGAMRRSLLFSALLVLAACFPSAASAAPERYIVVLKDGVSDSAQVASEHSRRHGASVGFVYGHALKGYSATIPSERVAALRADSRVAYVVPDGVASAVAQTLPWGIDKIDADLSSTLAGNGSGAVGNVHAYVIDSGIAAHPDLNLAGHVNFANGKNTDCNGHGTHVAGTIAARDNASDVVGVAPGAPLTGVKVLGCNGSGSWSGVIKGIDWVTANAIKPAVANMSLGGGANQAVDDAVKRSAGSGVFYALAAGNDGANACNSSPARAGTTAGVVTTAATDSLDREASWSNYGTCVDIWSPGVSILSTRRGGGTTTMSGTSMASPHSAGGGALYLSRNTTASAAAVESALKSSATPVTGSASKDGRAIKRLYVRGF